MASYRFVILVLKQDNETIANSKKVILEVVKI